MNTIPNKFRPTLETLSEAAAYSSDVESERWDFAVSIRRLEQLGLHETDLRWLKKKGLVEHQREVTLIGDDGRQFRPSGSLTFTRRSCFILTDKGIALARSLKASSEDAIAVEPATNGNHQAHPSWEPPRKLDTTPQWDVDSRTLKINEVIVKRFKWPALNQEAVLCAFQEEGWPTRIDDPLPPQPEQNPKRRLADTIKCLNRKRVTQLIHFRGDGTGEGVLWERRTPPDLIPCNGNS